MHTRILPAIATIVPAAATAGFFGPFADIPGTEAFADWAASQALWGDDLHCISADGPAPAVISLLGVAGLVTLRRRQR